jgi:hypothetical protein
MTRRGWTATVVAAGLLATFCLAAVPAGAGAQLAERVRGVDGVVRLSFATRAGVEICTQGIRMGDHHMMWEWRGGDVRAADCQEGSAQVELAVRGGTVRDVEVVRMGRARVDVALDLGVVTPGEAAGYLLSLVYAGATDDAAEDAIFPAMIADVEGVWRELLTIARDRNLGEGVRKNTLFWLGQEAAQAVTDGLADVAQDRTEGQEIRNAAIFALSQRDTDQAVPVLMELARTAPDAETRRTAMFWLAQSDDPRVVRFFEDVLLGKGL